MNTIIKAKMIATALVFVFALVASAKAQTEPKCDTKQTDCPNAETETVNADKDEAKASVAAAKFETVKFLPDSRRFATEATKEAPSYPAKQAKNAKTSESLQEDPAQAKPASNGSSPVDLITRVEVKYQYQNFSGGDLHGIPIIRGDYAFSRTASIRLDLPILHFDAQTPGQSSETGIGDIVLSATFVKAFSKKFIGAFGPRIDFPTATDDRLGSGKYVLKPLVAGVTPLAPGLAFVGILEYRVSIAGKDHRADVNEIAIKPVLLKSFLTGPLKGTYANPQLEFIVDFETNNRTTTQLGVNLGKVLSKNVVLFVVPTFHIAGTKRESFKLEAGFRYLFR